MNTNPTNLTSTLNTFHTHHLNPRGPILHLQDDTQPLSPTPGPLFVYDHYLLANGTQDPEKGYCIAMLTSGIVGSAPYSSRNITERERHANASLFAATHLLLAYAEAEEALAELDTFNDTYWEDLDRGEIARLRWELIDKLFPELAAQCPPISREEWVDWFGSEEDDLPYPEQDYLTREEWWGDVERTDESIYHKIHGFVAGLREQALATARGRVKGSAV